MKAGAIVGLDRPALISWHQLPFLVAQKLARDEVKDADCGR